jgi:multisubunit Na+/H+ antiporter MnhE subunit
MLISAFCLAKLVVSAKTINAKVLEIKAFENSETGNLIYAQSITLTPGTLTLDIKSRTLLVSYVIKPDEEDTTMKQKIDNILC